MKSRIIIFIFLFYSLSTSPIFSQVLNIIDFHPKVENGIVISASEKVLSSNLTSILHQVWVPSNWQDVGRILYSYTVSGLITQVSYDSLSNGTWKTFGSMTMEYNSGDQLVRDISYYYGPDGAVEHGVKWEYQYIGNKTSEGIQFMWDIDNELWESYKKEIYTYSGELTTKIEDYTDMGAGNWELAQATNITYDAQNREIESLTQTWSETDNQFTNSELTTTEYYKDQKMSKWESRSWDILNEQWSEENFTMTEYQYDGSDNCVEEVTTASFGIAGFSFSIKTKLNFSYDVNNYMIETIDYTWDDGSSQFLPILKSEITNNNEGMPDIIIDYIHAGSEWVKAEKYIYNYDGTVDVVDRTIVPKKLSLEQNYPNPFNPATTISYEVPSLCSVNIIIYDILGNYITTLVNETKSAGKYSVRFNAAELASGSYIYSIKSGNNIISKKCLLIK